MQRHKLFLTWAQKFGAIFRVQFGLHEAVVISDPAEWQKLLGANGAFNKWGLLYKASTCHVLCSPPTHFSLSLVTWGHAVVHA